MCGRYYIDAENKAFQTLIAEIAARSDGARLLDMNLGEIFPTNTVPALTAGGPRLMRWGFSRYNGGGAVINARSETAMVKPMFAKSMQERRCLLPASRYFEWQRTPGGVKKQKYAIALPGGKPFYLAGVYRQEKQFPVPVFAILTREAAPELAYLHERMPVALPYSARDAWLSPTCNVEETMQSCLTSFICTPAAENKAAQIGFDLN